MAIPKVRIFLIYRKNDYAEGPGTTPVGYFRGTDQEASEFCIRFNRELRRLHGGEVTEYLPGERWYRLLPEVTKAEFVSEEKE